MMNLTVSYVMWLQNCFSVSISEAEALCCWVVRASIHLYLWRYSREHDISGIPGNQGISSNLTQMFTWTQVGTDWNLLVKGHLQFTLLTITKNSYSS